MIACLWVEILSWDLVVQYNGPRRLGQAAMSSVAVHGNWGRKKNPFFFRLFDLIILNIYVSTQISSCLMINMLAVTAKQLFHKASRRPV
jgi:hypothetical protein